MAEPDILGEEEDGAGWRFRVRVAEPDGAPREVRLRLSWADYNLWSPSGSDEPAAVAAAVVRFLVGRGGADALREDFDASIARRLHADADEVVPGLIGA